jgi:hypothetical protein
MATFQIIDTRTGRVAFRKVSEREAHTRVDMLNAAFGTTVFKARRA